MLKLVSSLKGINNEIYIYLFWFEEKVYKKVYYTTIGTVTIGSFLLLLSIKSQITKSIITIVLL